jgi:hypothetical protein
VSLGENLERQRAKKAYKRKWYLANREKRLEAAKAWLLRNPKRKAAHVKEWERKNQDWRRNYRQEWFQANKRSVYAYKKDRHMRTSCGEFAEAQRVLTELEKEIRNGKTNGPKRSKLKAGTLGNASGRKKQEGRPKTGKRRGITEPRNYARRAS